MGRQRTDPPGSLKHIQEGIASFYADEFHGRKTANGEIYDMYAMTAAHQALPFNTRVSVTNLDNGKKVIVRINDRGPFVKGRIIDLSYGAAGKIGMVGPGTARVRLEVLEIGTE
jgi:rare lipoprotein A